MPYLCSIISQARGKITEICIYVWMFDFDYVKCIEAKAILGKNGVISKIWHDTFAPSNRIGNCTNLYRKHKPVSHRDFYEKYISYATSHPEERINDRGLSYEELLSLAERYKKTSEERTGVSYDLSTYFYDAVCHIIVETWNGQRLEREFMQFLRMLGYECGKFDGRIDAEYGVDIKVTRSDGRISAIQIKPISFFKSNRWDVQRDRISLCKKYEAAKENLGIKTYYAVYAKDKETGDVKWIKNGDGYRFRINELFSYSPEDIEGTFTRLMLPETLEHLPI